MAERANLWTVTDLPFAVDNLGTSPFGDHSVFPQIDHRSLGQRHALTHSSLDNTSLCFGLTTLTTGSTATRRWIQKRGHRKTTNRTLHMSMEPDILKNYQQSAVERATNNATMMIGN